MNSLSPLTIPPQGTVTFLYTDIEGSTQLLSRLQERYTDVLAEQRRILREAFNRRGGYEVGTQGDSFFVSFQHASEALEAVVEAQRALAKYPWPEGNEVYVRMGLHTGEPWVGEQGYIGMDVHRTARIGSAGYGGQVLLSETTATLVRDQLPEGISLLDLGLHKMKDISYPEHIYQTVFPDLPSFFPPIRSQSLAAAESPSANLPRIPVYVKQSLPEIEPTFVARKSQFSYLDGCLDRAIRRNGSVVFITGEVGSGKSALMDSFTRRSMQEDPRLLVARGVCNSYTGIGDPYTPFKEIFSMLTADVEGRWSAGTVSCQHAMRLWQALPVTLKIILEHGPDLFHVLVFPDKIPAYASEELPNDEGQFDALLAQARRIPKYHSEIRQSQLFEQCVHVLTVLADHHPLILIVDDLHWADTGSIALLHELADRIAGSPILILGAYRPADVAINRPDQGQALIKLIGEAHRQDRYYHIDLDKTVESENFDFVHNYLDLEPNRFSQEFCQDLLLHTGGHPLFTIELLRDMKAGQILKWESEGGWVASSKIEWRRLPERVEGVIEERVARLDPSLLQLLEIACVEGVRFTAQVLAMILALDEYQVLRTLSWDLQQRYRLVEDAGETIVDGRVISHFRFSNVIFQRYLYNKINQAQKYILHRRIAEAIEKIYPAHLDQVAAILVDQYFQVGDQAKIIQYLILAGEQAYSQYAYEETIEIFSRALELMKKKIVDDSAVEHLQLARCHIRLGEAYLGSGHLLECREHLQVALYSLNAPVPGTTVRLLSGLAGQLARQGLHRLLPGRFIGKNGGSAKQSRLSETARTYSLMADLFFVANQELPTIYSVIRALNLAERLGPSIHLAEAYAEVCMGLGFIPLHGVARRYRRYAEQTLSQISRPASGVRVALVISTYELGTGNWSAVERSLIPALTACEEQGNWHQWEECLVNLGNNAMFSGEMQLSQVRFERLVNETRRRGNKLHLVWGLEGMANHQIRSGEFESARANLEECLSLLARNADQITEFEVSGLLALTRLRLKDYQGSADAAQAALRLLTRSNTSYSMIQGYTGVTQAAVELWGHALRWSEASLTQQQYGTMAAKATRHLRSYARIFAIGRPHALRYAGLTANLAGSRQKAWRNWQKSLETARALQMPYAQGLAQLELGGCPLLKSTERKQHLLDAFQIFDQLGAAYDLTQACDLLEEIE